jgi:hypothetical protein
MCGVRGGGARANLLPSSSSLSGPLHRAATRRGGTPCRTGGGGVMKAITCTASVVVSVFLFVGVVDKLLHWMPFVIALVKNPLVPSAVAGAVAGCVIASETLVAALLLPSTTRRYGFGLGAVMFLFFTVVIALLLWIAPATPCGCSFGMGSGTPSVQHLALNILLALLCAYLFITGFRTSPANGGVRPPLASAATSSPTTHHRSEP